MTERPAAETDDLLPRSLLDAWQQGEAQLCSTALAGADTYTRALDLVRHTLEHLRERGVGAAGLVAAAGEGAALVTAASGGPATDGLDLRLVAQAALAMRSRELLALQAAARRVEALRAAAARGEAWVVLESAGDPGGDPFLPYRRLEVEVATGRGLLVTAEPDEQFRGCVHAVEPVRVDPATGAVQVL